MAFIDEVKIKIGSGRGGNGRVGYRREKFVPLGGPDGGNGGKGGDVIFIADEGLNTLMPFRGRKVYQADHGDDGAKSLRDGRSGKDLVIKVPVGTLVKNAATDEILFDLTSHGFEVLALKGGRGGLGNHFFKSSTNQTPDFAQDGEPGEELDVQLELKLIADIGLVGLPNAGKSTLISSISAARPKVADYPFTTLEPQLGVVKVDDESIVVADIPGLIEDAADGKGLGIQFLKHIERTSAFVHLVDISWCLNVYEAFDSYTTIRNELEKYDPKLLNKKEIICLTKIDAMTEEEIQTFQSFFEKTLDKKVIPLSSVSGHNLDILKRIMLKTKED